MVLSAILAALALLSLGLTLWQWVVARRFPIGGQRVAPDLEGSALPGERAGETRRPAAPTAITLLKPLKGCDAFTEECLRSWFAQKYAAPVQVLLGVAGRDDPVVEIVHKVQREFPGADARLVICEPLLGANAKVSQLAVLEPMIKHEVVVISDADVRVPPDLLTQLAAALSPPSAASPGLACCFYRLANPSTLAMRWEAIAINADFWSQVLQAQSLKPIDFALGAVMALPRRRLEEIGGFKALMDCLADDYQLGNRLARLGHRIVLCPVVVECWSAPMSWADVWKHQLRWAHTIRVCQPAPYFFSILSNATLWPLIWAVTNPSPPVVAAALFCWLTRVWTALDLQRRLNRAADPASLSAPAAARYAWLVPAKDLLQAAIWLMAFLGNQVEWRGQKMRLRSDGTLERAKTLEQ
ncbi:MAG TPA: glycosyltransferase [Candidatus Acidoferrum sp.]|nr:glycosyltransferase [Candidatus Acidoferrum sp.]